MTMTTFHLFPQLPPEIRIQIWELTGHQRYIHLSQDEHGDAVTMTVPAVVHVCSEARVHSPYRRVPLTELTLPEKTVAWRQERWIWVDFDIDIICIPLDYFCSYLSPYRIDNTYGPLVQRLGIDLVEELMDCIPEVFCWGACEEIAPDRMPHIREMIVLSRYHLANCADFIDRCYVKRDNVKFVDLHTGLIITYNQLEVLDKWHCGHHFDGYEADPADIDWNVREGLRLCESLGDLHELDEHRFISR